MLSVLLFIGVQHAKIPKLMRASVVKTGLLPQQKDDLLRRWGKGTAKFFKEV